tara:strand:- start:1291 stop:2214 length:924 start_codon:yes stop_codon:yes gene_type:complete
MITKTLILYLTLPIWSTIFSLVSKATLAEIDAKSYTGLVLLITAGLSLIYNFVTKIVTKINMFSIFAGCSYGLATLFFEEALNIATTPGLVNGLYRSQVALTAIASVYFLGSDLSYTSMLGIIITIMGAFIISLHKSKHVKESYEPGITKEKKYIKDNNENTQWVPLVLLAGLLATVKDIAGVYSVKQGKMKPSSFVFSQCFFGAITVLIYQYFISGELIPKLRPNGNWENAIIGITSAGLDNFLREYVLIYLMSHSRNIAYPKTVTMLGIPLTALIGPFIFNVNFPDSTQWGAIAAIVAGTGLISL